MTSLVVLEAAARRLSFTKAAGELNVTQAAVSRQIHRLEQELGFALFRRLHRRVELTERGRVLSGVLSHSFNLIAQTIANLRAQSAEDELVIGATSAASRLQQQTLRGSWPALHGEACGRLIRRTAVVRTRMPGGVGGAAS